jgi:hypothetical protein
MRSQTRLFIIERRDDMLYAMHGEIYGGVEYSFQAVYQSDTAREWEGCCWGRGFLVELWTETIDDEAV